MSLSTMDVSHGSSLGFSQNPSVSLSGQSCDSTKTHGGALRELGSQNKTHNKRDYQYRVRLQT